MTRYHTTSIPAHLEIGSPRNLPLAAGFQVMFCSDPSCGPHIVLLDLLGIPFCELLLSRQHVTDLSRLVFENLQRGKPHQ